MPENAKPRDDAAVAVPAALAARLRSARRWLVLSGSGVSSESGIPTFREAGTGLWARYDPRELATPAAFARDPLTVWAWYQWRRARVTAARPNRAHEALARLERAVPHLLLVTQNVDGLHQQAGSRNVVELHGNIMRTRCNDCGAALAAEPAATAPPSCRRCGGLGRPDVVWFGETVPEAALASAVEAARQSEVFVAAGTSAVVHPAASLAGIARAAGAFVLEINLEPTPLTPACDLALQGSAGERLSALAELVQAPRSC